MLLQRFLTSRLPRLLALTVAMGVLPPAWADDYAEVSQLVQAGRTAEALAKADQYLRAKPRDPQMRFLRGVILSETGRTAEAIQSFTRLTEDYPELPEPYNNLAVLYAAQNQFDKARAALESAIRTNPSYATAHENLGDIYARLAGQAYNRALQLDASNTTLAPKLALVRELFSQPRPAPRPAGTAPATLPAAATQAAPTASAPAGLATRPTTPAAAPAPVPTAPANSRPAPAAPPVASASSSPTAGPATGSAAATASSPPAAAPAALNPTVTSAIEGAVQAWAAAWSRKDMRAYLAAYASEFDPPGSQSRRQWEQERRQRIEGKSRISVKLSELDIRLEGDTAVVRFRQNYSVDALNVTSRKTLHMQQIDGRWLILRESVGA